MTLLAQMGWTQELLEAIPVIISLILIEGLLSVDNALAIAAMASHLPGRQKVLALRFGVLGAYVFRGLALAFATWIIDNPWLKFIGALYLIYLACSNLTSDLHAEAGSGERDNSHMNQGFWPTVIGIEIMDLSLSVDNVVAAVALSPKLWVVVTGVFIGIMVLRFLAGYCIRLIAVYPVLGKTAFLLVGFVGVLLVAELATKEHVHAWQKFIGVMLITVASIAYSRSSGLQGVGRPIFQTLLRPMSWFARAVEALFWPIRWCLRRSTLWMEQRSPKA